MSLSIGKRHNHFNGVRCAPSRIQCNKSDKIDQYKRIESIVQRNLDLERAKYDLERIVKQQRLNELRQNVKETKLKLNKLNVGEFDAIKHLLRGYKSSIRLGKSLDKLFEHCDCKRDNKRRELDRLNNEMNKLTDAYASKLITLTKMHERRRPRCGSESNKILASRMKTKAALLDKSEIEIQNYEKLVKDLERTVKHLSKESLHYANSLKTLEAEINKQNKLLGFLRTVSVAPAKRTKRKTERQPQKVKDQVFDKPSDNFDGRVPNRNDPRTMEVENRQSLEESINRSATKCSTNELTTIHSMVKRIQFKLAASKEKVNVLKNQFGGNTEDDAMRSNLKGDGQNRKQSTYDLQAKQNASSAFRSIPMGSLKVRNVLQRFADLLRTKKFNESICFWASKHYQENN